ncbi:pyridoxal phosphate-dependent decarboxylase family protein [Methylophaga lonarensis]|nr:aminotransferase class V-fold PLP-dependent enzyme [Methylophaga lonarensis]
MNSKPDLTETMQQLLAQQLPAALMEKISPLLVEAQQHQQSDWASHMTPTVDNIALLGKLLAGLHHGNLLSAELYPHLMQTREALLADLSLVFEQPHGHFTHGAGYANLEALWWARQQHPERQTVYASSACHYSLHKACELLSLKLELVPVDSQEQMQIERMQQCCEAKPPLAIIANAGTTRAGAIDDINALIELAEHYAAWLHIDAAWGGALAFDEDRKNLLGQIGKADSICIDPHKALQQPRPCGLLFYQHDPGIIDFATDYLHRPPQMRLPGSNGAELFMPLWLSWQYYGQARIAAQIKNRLEQADVFANQLSKLTGWRVLNGKTGIVCFSPDSFQPLPEQSFSEVSINGELMMRTVFSSQHQSAEALLKIVAHGF